MIRARFEESMKNQRTRVKGRKQRRPDRTAQITLTAFANMSKTRTIAAARCFCRSLSLSESRKRTGGAPAHVVGTLADRHAKNVTLRAQTNSYRFERSITKVKSPRLNLRPSGRQRRFKSMTRATAAAVTVRAIVPSDADNYRSILQRTSAEDRFCRFFHTIDHFDDAAVARYVKASPDSIGFLAEAHARPVGVAHAFFSDEGCAEIALVVANDSRHRGVGRLLFERLIAALQQRRCKSIIAYALAQNGSFSNLARSFGMRPGPNETGIVTWTLSLAGIPQAQPHANRRRAMWTMPLAYCALTWQPAELLELVERCFRFALRCGQLTHVLVAAEKTLLALQLFADPAAATLSKMLLTIAAPSPAPELSQTEHRHATVVPVVD